MSETMKTGAFVIVAIAVLAVAFLVRPAAPERMAFDDSGERFFEPFDPLDAAGLEIVAWDDEAVRIAAFKVARVNGRWSIPSHEDYPADAEQQLGKAAASVVDLVKGPAISDLSADHALYEVVDPLEDDTDPEGTGTRVTMRGDAGAVLADFIIGGAPKDAPGLRFVRVPGRDRVYTARVDPSALSTKFEEWIEADLLRLDPADVREIVINDYTVDEINQRIDHADLVELVYDDVSAGWTFDGLGESEQVRTAVLDDLKRGLDDLKIINVHRKPAGLGAELRADDSLQLDRASVQSLASRGFYLSENSLVSNQGETIVRLRDGVIYVLRFGEIALGEHGGGLLDGEEPDEEDEGAARYLFVMARFDPALIDEPQLEPVPEVSEDVETETAEGEPAQSRDELIAERDRIVAANARIRSAYEKRIADGRAKVTELNDRFADWYYVISNGVYRKIRLSRADLVEPVATEVEPTEG